MSRGGPVPVIGPGCAAYSLDGLPPIRSEAKVSVSVIEPRPRSPARICLIRQGYFPLDPRVRRQVDALLRSGFEVDVICKRRPDEPALERHGPLVVHRVPIAGRPSGHLNYLVQYGAFFVVAATLAASLHVRLRFDLVQVSTMPDSLVFAAFVPRLLGARILLDLHECMPEFYAVKFGTGLTHPVVRLIAGIEQAAIRFADAAITCTDQMRVAYESRGTPRHKVQVIVNSADESEFDPSRYRPAKRGTGEFTIICHGTVERVYGIDTIVRAVALLRDEIPGLRLEIYGEGTALPEIRSLISELQIENRVKVSGRFVPMDVLVQAIANADAGVVAMRRDLHRDLTHCNKMFDYIAMRKPAIVSRTRSVEAYFDDQCFAMFEPGDERDLARAIRELYLNPELGTRLAEQAAAANEPYRWALQRKLYQDIVRSVIGKGDGLEVGDSKPTETGVAATGSTRPGESAMPISDQPRRHLA
jgi:glycosyltransferase involved in cell wall biosynthesis